MRVLYYCVSMGLYCPAWLVPKLGKPLFSTIIKEKFWYSIHEKPWSGTILRKGVGTELVPNPGKAEIEYHFQ